MICFPPCDTCPGLCKQAGAGAVSEGKPARHPAPNRNLVRLKCGCPEQIPFPMLRVLGEHIDRVLCDRHGWQELAPEPKKKKARNPANPDQGELIPY